jgi:predicted nucleic acid-binding protein
VTQFLLDTSTVSAAVWKKPDPGVLAQPRERAAEWPGEERARLERTGRTAPFVDGPIAAVTAASGIPLITANPTDFKWFKGLTVHDWVTERWV